MDVKLIAIDIDGTLLNSKSELTPKVKESIIKASKKGVKIVLSSGRPFVGLKWLLEELDLLKEDEYTIAMNGTQVVVNKDESRIYKKYIEGKDVKEAFELSKKLGSSFFFFSNKEEVTCQNFDEYVNIETTLNRVSPHIISFNNIKDDDEVCKMTFTSSSQKLNEIEEKINEKFGKEFTIVRSHKNFLELFNPRASKGKAINFLCQYLNIDLDDTIAIGDNDNDYALLKECGIKVVMNNSKSTKLRSIATEIAPSNDEDGVSYIIDKYVNNK